MRRPSRACAVKRILITAGPTREKIDPVRFISNHSTGEMGYALARAALKKKYSKVTLVSGPTALKAPKGADFYSIESAADLKRVTEKLFKKTDILIMSAAVSDFTVCRPGRKKMKRSESGSLKLALEPTEDIVGGLARKKGSRLVIGFCLETNDWLQKARAKCLRKHLDGIVANVLNRRHNPFGAGKVTVALIENNGKERMLVRQNKTKIAEAILNWIEGIANKKNAK